MCCFEYKAQQSTVCEACAKRVRGFRFLKDRLFFTSSVFLNSAERVAALAMVMGLCLLVYSFVGQRARSQALLRAKQTIDNQLGKPTATPTLRWVFQCFMSIHAGFDRPNQASYQLNPGKAMDSPVFWCSLSKILSSFLEDV
ncbi:hypothetical protein NIES4073_09620 [Kalymmatonema gypsitolerans NIES-4073]|nr:hypothetical protein NIES4073_09620 [Scytonema sp. NIES-4073]